MQLIENWKAALKMYSVQLALVFAAFEWYDNLMEVALPSSMSDWMYHLIGLVFVVLRVISQPELHGRPMASNTSDNQMSSDNRTTDKDDYG